jgi:hypothetical protein
MVRLDLPESSGERILQCVKNKYDEETIKRSALVVAGMPGIWAVLKHYTRDIVLMVVGFACPVVFGVKVLEQVFIVLKKIE